MPSGSSKWVNRPHGRSLDLGHLDAATLELGVGGVGAVDDDLDVLLGPPAQHSMPLTKQNEQADPGGVIWTKRRPASSTTWSWSAASRRRPLERLRAVDVGERRWGWARSCSPWPVLSSSSRRGLPLVEVLPRSLGRPRGQALCPLLQRKSPQLLCQAATTGAAAGPLPRGHVHRDVPARGGASPVPPSNVSPQTSKPKVIEEGRGAHDHLGGVTSWPNQIGASNSTSWRTRGATPK